MRFTLRPALPSDAETVANLYLASRTAFLPYAPLGYTDEQVRHWIANVLIASGAVTAAVDENEIVGMMATSRQEGVGWIDQLYIAPKRVGEGIGSQLLDHAKFLLMSPIRLYTFQENIGARRFYERHGFAAIEFNDGQRNEEQCPDVLYEWASPA